MRKLVLVLLPVFFMIILSGCVVPGDNNEQKDCEDGFELINGICEEIMPTCGTNQYLDNSECKDIPECNLGMILDENVCIDDPNTVVVDEILYDEFYAGDDYKVYIIHDTPSEHQGLEVELGVLSETVYYFDMSSQHEMYIAIKGSDVESLLNGYSNDWFTLSDLSDMTIPELLTRDLVCSYGEIISLDQCILYFPTEYDLSTESYTINTIFEIDDAHATYNTGKPLYTPIASHEGSTYMIYIDINLRPVVVKVNPDLTYDKQFLDQDEIDIYYNRDDGHHFWSIGVDKEGYIHVVGDMHNYAVFNGAQDHMPDRYRYGRINYWRSDNPGDISSFTWYGDSDTMAPQGTGHTYVAFTNDYEGNLYYYARVVSPLAPTGEMKKKGFGISMYDAETQTWTSLGEINEYGNDVVIYEDDAENYSSTYSKIHAWMTFWIDNTAHIAAPILNTSLLYPEASGHYSSHAVYVAYNPLSGEFNRADGTIVYPPLRIDDDGVNDQIDVVYEILNGRMMATLVSITVDYMGRPIVQLFDQNKDEYVHMRYNGTSWDNLGNLGLPPGNDTAVHTDLTGVITIVRDDKYITRMFDEDNIVNVDLSGYGFSFILDRKYLADTGNYLLLPSFSSSDPNTLKIVEVIINRPVEYPEVFYSEE